MVVSCHHYIRNLLKPQEQELVKSDRATRWQIQQEQIRRTAKSKFTRKKNQFYNAIAKKESMSVDIEGKLKELTDAWHKTECKHGLYVILLEDDDEQDKKDAWINELQEIYVETSSIYNKCASENL